MKRIKLLYMQDCECDSCSKTRTCAVIEDLLGNCWNICKKCLRTFSKGKIIK